jgi:predicted cobalt transporter CbtA
MWSKIALRLKNLRRDLLLTGGFTLISTGVGMRVGLWFGLLVAGFLAVAYEHHLSRRE